MGGVLPRAAERELRKFCVGAAQLVEQFPIVFAKPLTQYGNAAREGVHHPALPLQENQDSQVERGRIAASQVRLKR